jgi:hypothetical protein
MKPAIIMPVAYNEGAILLTAASLKEHNFKGVPVFRFFIVQRPKAK